MELSFYLAQLMGSSLAIFAVAGLMRPNIVNDALQDLKINSLQTLIWGFMGIVVGLAVILSHNILEMSWIGIVTIFGWAALLKGLTTLFAPNSILDFGKKIYSSKSQTRAILAAGLVVGLYLAYKGFGN